MTLRTAFSLCFSVLVLAGVSAVAMAEGALLFIPAAFGLFALRSYLLQREERVYLSKAGATVLNCLAFVFVGLDMRYISGQLMLAMAHFLILVQLIRLFEAKRCRDYGLMTMMAIIHMAVAAIVSLEFVLALPLLAVFLATPPTLMLLTVLQGVEDCHEGPIEGDVLLLPETAALRAPAGLWAAAAGAGGAGFALGIFIFATMPRLRTQFFGHEAMAEVMPVTGFDEEVQLENIGEIKQNSAEVMKVWFERNGQPFKPTGIEPYFRGLTLERYDGRQWKSATTDFVSVRVRRSWRKLPYPSPLRRPLKRPGGVKIVQRYALQPIDTHTLFALAHPIEVRSSEPSAFGFEPQTEALVVARRPMSQAFVYSVRSLVFPDTPQRERRLRAASERIPQYIRRTFLSLPPGLSRRVRRLARRLVPSGPGVTEYDKVKAIEKYFQKPGRFTYTLDVQTEPGKEPIDAFLFERKEGHCAFFASAMVVLLRCVDVPARMVNGFYGGEWNEFGGYYLVRQADAHSWVEAYFPGEGWIPFDPTPAGERESAQPGGWYRRFTMFIDYLDSLWLAHVVGYAQDPEQDEVLGLASRVKRWFRRLDARLSGAPSPGGFLPVKTPDWRTATPWLVLGALVVAAAAAALAARALGVRFIRRLGVRQAAPRVRFYRRFLDMMARRGYVKRPCETPGEFLARLAGLPSPARRQAEVLTRWFCAVRYGGASPSPRDAARIEESLAALARLPRRIEPALETKESDS